MKCRCGHGRQAHHPTSKGRRYAQAQRLEGRTYPTRQPCHQLLPWNGIATRRCGCRDWHPEESRA